LERKAPLDMSRVVLLLLRAKDLGGDEPLAIPKIPLDVSCYVKTLLLTLFSSSFDQAERNYLRACIGSVLLAKYGIRNAAWCSTPAPGFESSVDNFIKCLYRVAAARNGSFTSGAAFWSGAADFIAQHKEQLDGAAVNFDPAWPYKSPTSANPYETYLQLGEVLYDDSIPHFTFWKDPSADGVCSTVAAWVTGCLEYGARVVFVWNQTTNIPSKEVLEEVLNAKFTCSEVLSVSLKSEHRRFTDYVLRLTPKKKSIKRSRLYL
jgi:hypothetical protein